MNKELQNRLITASFLMIAGASIFFLLPAWCFSSVLRIILIMIVVRELPALFAHNKALWFMLPFYPMAPFIALIALNESPYRILLAYLILFVACNDSGAYFAGIKYGKHKIAPTISPKKSWEGFIGGWLLCALAIIISMIIAHGTFDSYTAIWLSFLIATIGTAGDFFESWLKRNAGLKDSGIVLPGHGGLLDRFDAIMIVGVFFWFMRSYLANIF